MTLKNISKCISLCLNQIDGGTTWSTQTLTGLTGYNEINVYFFNATIGWIVSTGGFIFKTTDAGTTWIAQTSGTTQTLRDVCFINANISSLGFGHLQSLQ